MHKSNPFSYWIWLLPFLMVNLVNKYKIILPEKRAKPMLDFLKSFLKSVKSLNRISWVMEYWLIAFLCQIWLTNINTFFWESVSNLGYLRDSMFVQDFIMVNLVNKYKIFFLENRGKPWNSPKTFSLHWSFL